MVKIMCKFLLLFIALALPQTLVSANSYLNISSQTGLDQGKEDPVTFISATVNTNSNFGMDVTNEGSPSQLTIPATGAYYVKYNVMVQIFGNMNGQKLTAAYGIGVNGAIGPNTVFGFNADYSGYSGSTGIGALEIAGSAILPNLIPGDVITLVNLDQGDTFLPANAIRCGKTQHLCRIDPDAASSK